MWNAFRRFFPKPIGFPLGMYIPLDPADHAEDFSHRYFEPLDWQACVRMEHLGIPKDRIGSSDHDHEIAWCAFNPYERDGGGISTEGRINIDSELLNPE
jgi:hypothetical protein